MNKLLDLQYAIFQIYVRHNLMEVRVNFPLTSQNYANYEPLH